MNLNKDRLTLLGGAGLAAGLGAGLMYLLDPEGGRQRRALAREKCLHAAKTSGKAVSKATKGLVAEAGSKLRLGGRKNGNGAVADLQNEPALSGELASHGDSLHHSDLLPHDQHRESPALRQEPFKPVLS
jgi:hypothetical protein